MSKMRSIQLSMLIAVAFCALTATSASASPEWWVEGKVIANPETIAETIAIKKHPTITVSAFTGECSTIKVRKGVIEPGNNNSIAGMAFEGCDVVSQPGCEVPNYESEPLLFPLEGTSGNIRLNFRPKSGTLFAVVVIKKRSGDTCLPAGTYDVTTGVKIGMVCTYPGVETEKVEHELVFNKETGSEVFLNGTAAVFAGEFAVKLSSGKKWSAK
jgi:hypothetical protein